MSFVHHFPPYPLSQYIEYLWGVQMPLPYKREKILPTGGIDMMINFGEPYRLINKEQERVIQHPKHSWIVGMTNEYIVSEATGTFTDMVGVRFKPGGAYAFFHFPVAELNHQLVEMDQIWGRFIHQARERLGALASLEARITLLQNLLLHRIGEKPAELELIQSAVSHLAQPHTFTIKNLSDHIGISQKHLITLFKKFVGLPPKGMARIFRFNAALQSIDPFHPVNWTEIAHHCHYHDQAHFNKDFAAFGGLTPSAYLEYRSQFLNPDPNQVDDIRFVPLG
jgi:AraC-like DNA-binding protein